MAFAYLHLKSYKEAATQYQACIECAVIRNPRWREERIAMNLSSAYKALADTPNSEAWLEKANAGTQGVTVYRYFHPGEE